MAKQTDKTSSTKAGPAKPKKQPPSSGRIRAAVASAGPSGMFRRITRQRRATFTPSTFRIAGPLSFTRGGMFATFVLGGQQWDFRSDSDRMLLWDQATFRWASLKGRSIKLRSTPRPYPSYEFARTLDEDTPSPLPDVPGAPSWDAYLEYGQRRLQQTGLDTKMVTLSVWVGPNPSRRVQEELIAGVEHPLPETVAVIEEILRVTNIVKGAGFNGRPVGPRDMAFLMHRSLSMGIPAPMHAGAGGGRWEPDEISSFFTRREWFYNPLSSSTVKVVAEHNGKVVERHVAVLSLGPLPDITWPESGRDPWMLASDKLGFPVEWSMTGAMLDPKDLSPAIEFEQNRAAGIQSHYAEHNLIPPPAVERAIEGATLNLDEVTEGDTRTAVRFLGPIRLATYAATEAQCLEQARALVDSYGERMNFELAHPRGQAQLLREFVPGEPWSTVGYQRRLPARYLASAMPNVDADVGTPTGPYLAYGIGSARRAVRFDPHYGPETLQQPGLFTITAEPGGGKSVLIGALAYNAARRGEPTIILDPSGPLAKLCELPELKPYSRVLDLTASEPGTLSPYQLIPEPQPGAYLDDQGRFNELDFGRAKRIAVAERQQLVFDVLRMWLPLGLLREVGTDVKLRSAIRNTRYRVLEAGLADVQTNPRWVVEELAKLDNTEHIVAEIEAAAEFPLGELVMPDHTDPIPTEQSLDKTLVVVTMPGLEPPPEGLDRELWGSTERYTQPLLHLAAFFTSRFIYGRNRNQRKNVFLDENHQMATWGSGRALMVRLSRDSRKWDTAIGAASQHPDDALTVGRIDALQGAAFVGRLTKQSVAEKACDLLQCPRAYAPVIQALSPRRRTDTAGDQELPSEALDTGEFVFLDPLGRIGKVRIDIDWHPGLREALNTTPGRRRLPTPAEAQPTPFLDPELFTSIPLIPLDEEAA
ncbi:MAG TPA: ATP-binding protein [Propionibacteriaceae bacterium]|nr:ATP-binding protein [Propionibacteriaceae bacterium]